MWNAQNVQEQPEAQTEVPALLSVKEVAGLLKCSTRWVRELIQKGELEVMRIGSKVMRVFAWSLCEFIKRQTVRHAV